MVELFALFPCQIHVVWCVLTAPIAPTITRHSPSPGSRPPHNIPNPPFTPLCPRRAAAPPADTQVGPLVLTAEGQDPEPDMSKEQAGLDPELLEKMTSPAGPVCRRRARRGAPARPWPYPPTRPRPPAAGRHAAGAAAAAAAPAEVAAAALHPRFLPPPAVVERLRRRLRRAGWPPAELQKRQFVVVLLRNAGPAGRGSGSGGSIFFSMVIR